jgi:hypothetical protein
MVSEAKNDCAGEGQQQNYCSAQSNHRKTNASSHGRGGLISKYVNGLEQKYGHGSWRGPEPRMAVLAEASSKITALLRVNTERPMPLLMEEEVSFQNI